MVRASLHNIMQVSGALEHGNSPQNCSKWWWHVGLEFDWTITGQIYIQLLANIRVGPGS